MPTRPPRHKPVGYRRPVPGPDTRPPIRRHLPQRGKTAERGYDSKWQKARAAYLRKHPLCVHCLATGIVNSATVVDHIEPHRLYEAIQSGVAEAIAAARALFWNSDNWQALCAPCHSVKTAAEDGGFGNKVKDHG